MPILWEDEMTKCRHRWVYCLSANVENGTIAILRRCYRSGCSAEAVIEIAKLQSDSTDIQPALRRIWKILEGRK